MATAPVKSQPLHNFRLSFLKWGKQNQMKNNRGCRRSDHSPLLPPPPDHQPDDDNDDDKERGTDGGGGVKNYAEPYVSKAVPGPTRAARNRFSSFASCSLLDKPLDGERRSADVGNGNEANVDEPSPVQKPWNLRPRRGGLKGGGVEIGGFYGGGGGGSGGSRNGAELQETAVVVDVQQSEPKSTRLRGVAEEGRGVEKREKKEKKARFWISLSKEEIEEDIFVMTGSKPSRRPRKRPRNVQKQLDNVFPGLWLAGVSADAYRVPDAPAAKR